MERTCKKCGETKPIEEFAKNWTCTSGRVMVCKVCSRRTKHRSKVLTDFKNRKEYLEYKRKSYRETLSDGYIVNMLRYQAGWIIGCDDIYKYPDLINTHRELIKIKRLIKDKEDEKCNRLKR
jgi:hypothetical protein